MYCWIGKSVGGDIGRYYMKRWIGVKGDGQIYGVILDCITSMGRCDSGR